MGAAARTPTSELETLAAARAPLGTQFCWFCKGWRLCRLAAELREGATRKRRCLELPGVPPTGRAPPPRGNWQGLQSTSPGALSRAWRCCHLPSFTPSATQPSLQNTTFCFCSSGTMQLTSFFQMKIFSLSPQNEELREPPTQCVHLWEVLTATCGPRRTFLRPRHSLCPFPVAAVIRGKLRDFEQYGFTFAGCVPSGGLKGKRISLVLQLLEAAPFLGSWALPPSLKPEILYLPSILF